MKYPKEFEYLLDAFKSLPGVGTKLAKKWVYFLINKDKQFIDNFVSRVVEANTNILKCKDCGNISNDELCSICNSVERYKNTICVVTTPEDLDRIESSGHYDGLYHITYGDLSIKKNVLVQHTNLESLFTRLENNKNITELIIATGFTHDGEMTASYITNRLEKNNNIKIYRIGFGIPLNSSLDYADNETLKHSLNNKRILK